MSMSQLSAYSSSGFLFTYVHNICRSIELTYFEIHVLMHCLNLQCFYCPLNVFHLIHMDSFCFFFWTPMNDVSFCELWGSGLRYFWIVPMSSGVIDSRRFRGTHFFHLRLRKNPGILENGRLRIREFLKIHSLLLFGRQTKYPII